MGRYDFRPSRVYQTATQNLASNRIKTAPVWLDAVQQNPPPQILVRTQPVQHTGYSKQRADRKMRKLFRPQKIRYPEDSLRKTFFTDHPWELARPRILLEGNRLDGGEDWTGVRPKGLGLQPENVIRRQLWLIEHENQDPQTAYNTARREFYSQRLREDIERKVAKEEALHVGAYFGKSTIAWGMELEDRKFYGFKQWAARKLTIFENMRRSMVLGVDDASVLAAEEGEGAASETEAAKELLEGEEEDSETATATNGARRTKAEATVPVDVSEQLGDSGGIGLRI